MSARRVVIVLLVAHLAYGVARLVQSGYVERVREVGEWRDTDPVGWHFRNAEPETQRIARWVVDNLPADQALLYEGEVRGGLQLLAGLIAPRVLLRADLIEARAESTTAIFDSAPLWFAPAPRGVVIVGEVERLRLRPR